MSNFGKFQMNAKIEIERDRIQEQNQKGNEEPKNVLQINLNTYIASESTVKDNGMLAHINEKQQKKKTKTF